MYLLMRTKQRKICLYQFLLKIECSGSWFGAYKLGGGVVRVHVVETIFDYLLKSTEEETASSCMH